MGNVYARLEAEEQPRAAQLLQLLAECLPRRTGSRRRSSIAAKLDRSATTPNLPDWLRQRMGGGDAERREPTSLEHSDELKFGSFSADGALLACGGYDKKVTVYETSGWAVVKELRHSATLWFGSFSADGALLACGGYDKKVTVYETSGWAVVKELRHSATLWFGSFSADGALLACGGYDEKATIRRTPLRSRAVDFWSGAPVAVVSRLAPADVLMLGTASDTGRTLLCAAAFSADLEWMVGFVQAATATPATAALLPACVLQPDVHGVLALHYAVAKAQPAAVKLLLTPALHATPQARRRLAQPMGSDPASATPSVLELVAATFPRVLASCIGKLPLEPYAYPPEMARAPSSLLSVGGGTLAVKGGPSFAAVSDFWEQELQGAGTQDEIDVQPRLLGVPGLTDGGNLFETIVHANMPELITSPAMRAAIAFKWQAYGARLWMRDVQVFALFLASYSVGLWLRLSPSVDAAWAPLGWPVVLIAVAIAVNYGVAEVREFRSVGAAKYASNPLNLTDIGLVAAVLLVAVLLVARALAGVGDALLDDSAAIEHAIVEGSARMLHAAGGGVEPATDEFTAAVAREHSRLNQLAALSMLLVWPKAISVARGNQRLSFLNDVITTTLRDMRMFVLILGFIMSLFSYSFSLMTGFAGVDEFASPAATIFTVWNMMLGDYEQSVFGEAVVMSALFYAYTFLINIVCLNSLIALMGDSWEKTQETSEARGLQKLAEQTIELEERLDRNDRTLFPLWVHCVERADADDDDAQADSWQGRIVALRKKIDGSSKDIKADIKANVADVKADVAKVKAKMEAKVEGLGAKMEAKMEGLDAKVGEMTAMLQRLLELSAVPAAVEATDVQVKV